MDQVRCTRATTPFTATTPTAPTTATQRQPQPPTLQVLSDQLWQNYTHARLTASKARAARMAVSMAVHQFKLPWPPTNASQPVAQQDDLTLEELEAMLNRIPEQFTSTRDTDGVSKCGATQHACGNDAGCRPLNVGAGARVQLSDYQRKEAADLCSAYLQLYRTQFDRTMTTAVNPTETRSTHYGCRHYARGVKIFAACCKIWVSCRRCHDEAFDHAMSRREVSRVLCQRCMAEQPVSASCVRCGLRFARYYCGDCRFYDDSGRDIYHCSACGTCRLGRGLGVDNYHCTRCDACVSLASRAHHVCHPRALHAECPVCREDMFTSTEKVVYLRCGHPMHASCFRRYTQSSFKCPVCAAAMTDMSAYYKRIDDLLAADAPSQQQPPAKRARVLCNDCGRRSTAPAHFLFHKCHAGDDCASYNTRVLDVIRDER